MDGKGKEEHDEEERKKINRREKGWIIKNQYKYLCRCAYICVYVSDKAFYSGLKRFS